MTHVNVWGRSFPAEEKASTKVLRWEVASVQRLARGSCNWSRGGAPEERGTQEMRARSVRALEVIVRHLAFILNKKEGFGCGSGTNVFTRSFWF